MKIKRVSIILIILIIVSINLVFASDNLVDKYGVKNDIRNTMSEENIVVFESKDNIYIDKKWSIMFNKKVTKEQIDSISIKKGYNDIPVYVKIVDEKKVEIIPINEYEYNTNYVVDIKLMNGMNYIMNFKTIQEFEYEIEEDGISIIGYLGTDEDIVVPEVINDIPVVEIGNSAFASSGSQITIDKLTLPNSIKRIESYAFYTISLGHVEIPESVTYIGNRAFDRTDLESVEIPDSVTYIGESAFSPLSENDIKLGSGLNSYFVIESDVLKGHIGKPNSNLILPNGIKEISSYAFYSEDLESVEIPDSVTYIGKRAFASLSESNIKLGSGLNSYFVIESDVLKGHIGKPNSNLILPNGIKEISSHAFYSEDLESVEIPDSVNYIGYGAFDSETIIIGKRNSDAERFAEENGNIFIEK